MRKSLLLGAWYAHKGIRAVLARLSGKLALCLLIFGTLHAQDPDIEANERRVVEEYFRTSEQPGETPTNRRQREQGVKRVSPPPGAARVGCICMDDTRSEATSIGACSGHGGVRFWLYVQPNGDTMRITTARHERHPHPLDSIERSELVSAAEKKRRSTRANAPTVVIVQMPSPPDDNLFTAPTWPEVIGIIVLAAITLRAIYLLLLWADYQIPFLVDALRDYLRHRRRPPENPNG